MNASNHRNSDTLARLLRVADQTAPPPLLGPGVADAVRLRVRRRVRHRRLAATSLVTLVVIASAAAIVWSPWTHPRPRELVTTLPATRPETAPVVPTPPNDRVRLAAEFLRAKQEAELRREIAKRLTAREQSRRKAGASNGAGPAFSPTQLDRIALLRGDAAQTLIGHADRLKSRASSPRDALATYRRAVELFPDTPAAAVARQRIEALQSQMQTQEIPS